tara:strand:+ start:84 stop:398 length:315 start_codon:yes stop_codon:yes gene_type:complete
MSIKHKIKIRKVTGIGVHGLATGDSLDLSDNAKASDELPASEGESARRSVPADDNVFKDKTISDDYKSGGAYKAMLSLFADHVSDEEYAEHCRRFFKGNNENNT